jgi:putative hydrolase of the HAD superfamily
MIKAIIFDIDNTLLDFMTMKSNAINAAVDGMIANGLPIEKDLAIKQIFDIYNFKGYEHQKVLNDFIVNTIDSIDYKILAAGIVEYKIAKEASLSLYPGVKDTLVNLSNFGLKLGILSDAPSREAWIRMYILKIHKIFDQVVTFNDTGFYKPAKEPFIKIKELLNVEYHECLMVGDWPERDIKGAKQLGMKTAFAKYGATEVIDNSDADYELVIY